MMGALVFVQNVAAEIPTRHLPIPIFANTYVVKAAVRMTQLWPC